MTPPYRTQKAQGLSALSLASDVHAKLGTTMPAFRILSDDDAVLAFLDTTVARDYLARGCMARPCPVTPQHGFVESRCVHTAAGLLERWLAARDGDPDAELIAMPFLTPEYSAVITPRSIAIGASNDGATNCGGGAWLLPFLKPIDVDPALLDRARIDRFSGQEWFAEIVATAYERHIVQLRAGEAPPDLASPGWIPESPFTPTKIIDGSAWTDADYKVIQLAVEDAQANPGTIIYLPNATLTCHAVIQSYGHRVPFTTEAHAHLEVGKPYTLPDELDPQIRFASFLDGIAAGFAADMHRAPVGDRAHFLNGDGTIQSAHVNAVCVALHHALAWRNIPAGCTALGVACALMLRLGTAAGWGEARHTKHPGKLGKPHAKDRRQVYDAALFPAPFTLRSSLHTLIKLFAHRAWGSSYGGKAWARCTAALTQLDFAVASIVRHVHGASIKGKKHPRVVAAIKADPATLWADAIDALNTVVNEAHNGGWWLNKFAPQSTLDNASTSRPRSLVDAGFTLYTCGTTPCDATAMLAPFLSAKHETPTFNKLLANVRAGAIATPALKKKVTYPNFTTSAVKYTAPIVLTDDTLVHAYPVIHPSKVVWHVQAKQDPASTVYQSWTAMTWAVAALTHPSPFELAADIDLTIKHTTDATCATHFGALGTSLSFAGSGAVYLNFTPTICGLETTFNGTTILLPYGPDDANNLTTYAGTTLTSSDIAVAPLVASSLPYTPSGTPTSVDPETGYVSTDSDHEDSDHE